MGMNFRDREDAGRQLAMALDTYKSEDPLVMGMARGGVPVAYEVSRRLHLPLDVLVVRKLGAPHNPELGIGALAPDEVFVLNDSLISGLRISERYIQAARERESGILAERLQRYRGGRPSPDLNDRTVILVDDGIATGVTALAALQWAHQQGAHRVILAVPVCSQEAAALLRDKADEMICLMRPVDFMAVGVWYQDFPQVSDEEVTACLEHQAKAMASFLGVQHTVEEDREL